MRTDARQERCARGKAWNLAKNIHMLKDKGTFHSPTNEWILPAASTIKPEEREFVVDSGAGMHMVSKRDLNSAQLETMRILRTFTTVMTANGEVQTREEATVCVKELDSFVTVMLLEETPAVLSLGKLCEETVVKTHNSPKMARTSIAKKANYVPFVVPGLSTSSSTSSSPTTSTSSSQDTVIGTENPATERSEIMCEESEGNRRLDQQKPKTQIKNEDDEESRRELLQDVPEWLQDFTENLVVKNVQPHQYSPSFSYELPMEPRARVVPGLGKHSVYTHFPKDPNCDICLRTKISRASCRRRAGTAVPRAL